MAMSASDRSRRIDQYAQGPERLRQALNRVPDGMVKWRPAPGKWSVHEIVCHAADSEVNAYARLRYLLAEKDPVIVGYDQEEWARRLDYHAHPLDTALLTVEAVRRRGVPLFGIVFNRLPGAGDGTRAEVRDDNPRIVAAIARAPVLGEVPPLPDPARGAEAFAPVGRAFLDRWRST